MSEPFLYLTIPGLEHYPHVTYTWVVMALFALLTISIRVSMKLIPTGWHNMVEAVVVGLVENMESVIGHGGKRFLPLLGTLTFFIFTANMIGLVPGCIAPTSNVNTNLAMALTVFVVYNFVGIQKQGFVTYFKHFMGPVWWLSWLIFPIEIISHLARPITLAMRLFGNVKGEDLVVLVLLFLVPLILPLFMMAFMVFTGLLQTIVFLLLAMVYLQGALAEEH